MTNTLGLKEGGEVLVEKLTPIVGDNRDEFVASGVFGMTRKVEKMPKVSDFFFIGKMNRYLENPSMIFKK